jgi:hypothetical protein
MSELSIIVIPVYVRSREEASLRKSELLAPAKLSCRAARDFPGTPLNVEGVSLKGQKN